MGYLVVVIKMPADYSDGMLQRKLAGKLRIRRFSWQIEGKSLDARNKRNIHWVLRVAVFSDELKGELPEVPESLVIPQLNTSKHVLVTGSGPAGFFCAFVLQKAGFLTTLIDRGSDVLKRNQSLRRFENEGVFDPMNNYAFGEGGAGTFSDGKLTSRSKHISKERQFILDTYIEAGAPKEIAYLAHPHLGTDNLIRMVKTLRRSYEAMGGSMVFETKLQDLLVKNGSVLAAELSTGSLEADAFFVAPGHAAYDTYRMLIRNGVLFRTKNFAIGSRMEHPQEVINRAQWGVSGIPGVKAAEYRLTSTGDGKHPVYSFCMCPGGMVVPATAFAHTNIVNGMSFYKRDGLYANAACVAGIHPDELAGRQVSPPEALDQLEALEARFYDLAGGYMAPSCSIPDFLDGQLRNTMIPGSYLLGTLAAPLWELLPGAVVRALRSGLRDFKAKMNGFESGQLLGLESKTSSPIQVIRQAGGLCEGFSNLYLIGEGSGYAGGIISSAADGVKAAMQFISQAQ